MGERIVLMLHGMGGDRSTMSTIGKFCGRLLQDTTFMSLEAPINLGTTIEPCLGWFEPPQDDKRALERADPPTFRGIETSLELVKQSIDDLIRNGADSKAIFVLGHSQGGAIAITTGLTYPRPLGGIFTIAGYLAWLPTMKRGEKSIHATSFDT